MTAMNSAISNRIELFNIECSDAPAKEAHDAFEDADKCAALLVFCVVVMPLLLIGWALGKVVEWVASAD